MNESTVNHTGRQTNVSENKLLTRAEVAQRWNCCEHTVARDLRLTPVRFNRRRLRYRLDNVERIEREAMGGFGVERGQA